MNTFLFEGYTYTYILIQVVTLLAVKTISAITIHICPITLKYNFQAYHWTWLTRATRAILFNNFAYAYAHRAHDENKHMQNLIVMRECIDRLLKVGSFGLARASWNSLQGGG